MNVSYDFTHGYSAREWNANFGPGHQVMRLSNGEPTEVLTATSSEAWHTDDGPCVLIGLSPTPVKLRDLAPALCAAPSPPSQPIAYAANMLHDAAEAISDRAAERDRPQGERSMAGCVAAFNALSGHTLSEREGWVFMALLKLSRAQGGALREDDYIDGAAYMALAGEAAIQAENGDAE